MDYKINHITNNKKLQGSLNPQYLTIHSTANLKSTAQNERDWLNNASNKTSTGFHIAVDDKEAIECIPLNVKAHHAGNSKGNNTSIGLEICESGDRQKTLDNAVKVTVKILRQFGWGVDKLRRHYDWSKKNCPRILNYNNWEGWTKFKDDVRKELGDMALRKGDKGSEVKKLQQDLISLGYSFGSYGADGSYGSATETTVKQFQKDNKLAVDGVSGPATQSKIQELISSKNKPVTGNDYLTKTEFKKILQNVISKL